MAAAIPLVMMAGSVISGTAKQNAADSNAAIMGYEAKTASAQGYEAEAQQRRKNSMIQGSQIAAAAQAGAGFGGSTGRAITQNVRNMTEDALSIRYKAQLQKWSYGLQAANIASEGQSEATSDYLRAGGALLRGKAGNYLG